MDSQLLDHFDRIYIINLPERADRRLEMESELRRHGLNVDGDRIRYLNAIRPSDAGPFPSVGARGCFMSHLAILKDAIDSRCQTVLVMEDDLHIDDRALMPQPEMCRVLQEGNWDFAYLGHVLPEPREERSPGWLVGAQPIATTHFYGLNRPVMHRLRDHLEACLARPSGHPLGSPMHVDGAYSLFRSRHPDILTLIAAPSLGGQRSSRSDIYPNKWFDKLPLIRELVGAARGVKNHLRRTPAASASAGRRLVGGPLNV